MEIVFRFAHRKIQNHIIMDIFDKVKKNFGPLGQYGEDALIEIVPSSRGPLRADDIADKYGESVVWLGNYNLLRVSDGQEK